MKRLLLLINCLIILGGVFSITSDTSTSPIKHWDASYTASCVHGSCLVKRYPEHDCVLILIRSPSTNIWKPTPSSLQNSVDLLGLSVKSVDDNFLVHFAPSWLSFSNGQVCIMTGFASDVEHLGRMLQKTADNHLAVYDNHITTHSMTQQLATVLQQAAHVDGGRPFGVQALLVGGDDIDPSRGFCIYSVDPSGGWQSWGQGTAIGKFAAQARKQIAKKRKTKPENMKEALSELIESWIQTCKAENVNLQQEEEYQALIIKESGNGCNLFVVDKEKVLDIVSHRMAANS